MATLPFSPVSMRPMIVEAFALQSKLKMIPGETELADNRNLQYTGFDSIPVEHLNSLIDRQFVYGERTMLARIVLRKGAIVPEHSHENEQITYILEGALRFTMGDGRVITVGAGQLLVIPSNLPHRAEALEDTVDLDVFAPPRADWIAGTDAYLRK
jgi:quercetin dioxygenase-like cupin family protein